MSSKSTEAIKAKEELENINKELAKVVDQSQPLLEKQRMLKLQLRMANEVENSENIPPSLDLLQQDVFNTLNGSRKSPTRRALGEVMISPTKATGSQGSLVMPAGIDNMHDAASTASLNPSSHSLKFATDLGQRMVEEVRRLQAELNERDELLRTMRASATGDARKLEDMETRLKTISKDEGMC